MDGAQVKKYLYNDGKLQPECFAHSYVELQVTLEETKGVGAPNKHEEIGIRNI